GTQPTTSDNSDNMVTDPEAEGFNTSIDDGESVAGIDLNKSRTHGTVHRVGQQDIFMFDKQTKVSRKLAKMYPEGIPVQIQTKVVNGKSQQYVVPMFEGLKDIKGQSIVRETYVIEGGFKPGESAREIAEATEKVGKKNGFTWHHSHDGKTLELVPTVLHKAIGHHGGSHLSKVLRFTLQSAEYLGLLNKNSPLRRAAKGNKWLGIGLTAFVAGAVYLDTRDAEAAAIEAHDTANPFPETTKSRLRGNTELDREHWEAAATDIIDTANSWVSLGLVPTLFDLKIPNPFGSK
ncbi:MAG: HNH endonuclease signature motif containing protein, partial [Gammaproteobacteria bacterium]